MMKTDSRLPSITRPCLLVIAWLLLPFSVAEGDDWPTWRKDAQRSAQTDEALPKELSLQWERKLPALVPAYRNKRLQFDVGYEPIVQGNTLFVGSSHNDSVSAFDTETGALKWRVFADGPVRFAPVAWQDRLFFGSDDGHLYCLNSHDGSIVWKFRAVPSDRKLLGNGRLISVWPVRGGPVIADGVLYFAAGVWSFEGVYVYAIDAKTGRVIWLNDRTGYIYGQHPHAAEAFGGLTPQGYLVVNGDDLIVPCGSALPARFDLKTGKLKSFELPKEGRYPGGWFAAASRAKRRGKVTENTELESGELLLDVEINSDLHEGGKHQGPGGQGASSKITIAETVFEFAKGYPGVTGEISSMLAANEKVFVATKDGTIRCFGTGNEEPIRYEDIRSQEKAKPSNALSARAVRIIQETGVSHGYCFIYGIGDGEFIRSLLARTNLLVTAFDPNQDRVNKLRTKFDRLGLYGDRVTIHVGSPGESRIPPYLASLIICDDSGLTEDDLSDSDIASLYESLRPFGGTLCFNSEGKQAKALATRLEQMKLSQAEIDASPEFVLLRRSGPLPGSTNYGGHWEQSLDALVKAPLGVLWFGDTVGHFKRAPQPFFVDGVMISHDKVWQGFPDGDRPPYAIKNAVYSDVYTGRVFSEEEISPRIAKLPKLDITVTQPSQYRPPTQVDAWKPKQPVIGERINPLTGKNEPRSITKSYGCDGGHDYGLLFTMRSGTAAYYDKRIESGTIHISGPRSGCTNSIIPANGLLNVPYFYQGCTCSYPLPVGLALAPMPSEYEQWTVWGKQEPEEIQRVGINFGAPGDRMTEEGTLWLDHPAIGGPSPQLSVSVKPESAVSYYQHSLRIEGGNGWPWVAASGIEGVSSVTIENLKESNYTVRLYFCQPRRTKAAERVFDVSLQSDRVIESLNITEEADGPMRSLVKEFKSVPVENSLNIELRAIEGQPILNGIELIADSLQAGKILKLKDRQASGPLVSN